MATINHLQSYAFAKKKGDHIDVFEGPHTLADFFSVIAEGSDVPRMLKDRFADVINVRDFGAKGNGTTDDTEAIQAALNVAQMAGGSTIVFPFGRYKVSSPISIPSGCRLDGQGSTVETTGDHNIFYAAGEGLVTEIALGANATTGDTSLTTASAHGLQTGDMALLWSQRNALSESAGDFRLGYHQGHRCYFAEPVAIKAVPSETQVTLTSGLIFPGYRTDASEDTDTARTQATIAKLNFAENIHIKNFVLQHSGEGAAIQAHFVKNLLIDNVVINTGVDAVTGVSLFGCYNVRINGTSMFVDPTADVDFDTEDFYKWTAVGCSSSWHVKVTDSHFGAVPNGVDFTFYGNHWCSMFCAMENSYVIGSGANGATSHPGVYSASFLDNVFVDCCVPLTVRSRKARIIGNDISNSNYATSDRPGIYVFTSAIDTVVSNNIVDGYYQGIQDHAYSSGVAMLEKHQNIYSGNRIKNCKYGISFTQGPTNNTELVSTIVQGNSIEFSIYGIECESWRHGVFAQGNYLKGTQTDAQSVAIRVEDDSTNHKFLDNIVENSKLYSINLEKTDSAYTETLDVNNNIIYGYDILIGDGAYLNNGTYPRVAKRYEKLILSRKNANVPNTYGAGTLLAVENNNGGTVSIVSADGNGFSTYDFLDNNLNRKASVGYGYESNRLNIGIEGSTWSYRASSFSPNTDNAYSVGTASNRASEIFAGTGTINTSDQRVKSSVASASDTLLDAVGSVPIHTFQFTDAVEKKGSDAARFHAGVIAQEVASAFQSKGLDATRYGLFCYDEWQDEYETVEVIDQEEVVDDEGNVVTPRVTHTEQRLVTAAGDRYGIRYEELLILECARLRRELQRMKIALTDNGIKVGDAI